MIENSGYDAALRNVSSSSLFGANPGKPVDIPAQSILSCHVEPYAGVFVK